MSFAERLRSVLAHRAAPTALGGDLFDSGTFTPTLTFATPGDLSVSYSTQDGGYWHIGGVCFLLVRIACTPTFTTASGQARVVVESPTPAATAHTMPVYPGLAFTMPTGAESLVGDATSGYLRLYAYGSGASENLDASDFSSGAAVDFTVSGFYPT